jgi:acylpyruvate hydrolase
LGVVIGKKGRFLKVSEALNHVAGYFLALDMTAKEFLKKSINQSLPWEIGKGFDTAAPVSHFIPKNLVNDPDNLDLSTFINGKLTQSDNTKNMIFNVSTLISYISKYMTLEPYDTIMTGTPDGLGPIHDGDVIQGFLGNLTTIRFEVSNLKDV